MRYCWILSLFTGLVWADYDHILYSKLDGDFDVLRSRPVGDEFFLTPNGTRKDTVPVFTLKNGIAFIGHGDDIKYLAVVDGFMVLGSKQKVTPLKIKLDNDFRITNFESNDCAYIEDNFKAKWQDNSTNLAALSCKSTELYLMTPIEAMRHVPTFDISYK